MACFHLTIKPQKNTTAKGHAEYICRQGKYINKIDELIHSDFGNIPAFAQDNPIDFWTASDRYERVNGRAYTEIEFALPNELAKEEMVNIVEKFIKENLGHQPYHYAIHENAGALSGEKNPHVHIMYSERQLDGIQRPREQFFRRANSKNPEIGGNKKNRDLIHKSFLIKCRKTCESIINKTLKDAGINTKVDCRSLQDQRIEALKNNDFFRGILNV